MDKNIFFIGFMGSGKSTVAKALAKRLERKFVDTDKIIAMQCKKSVRAIFAEFGEDFFRTKERELAKDLKAANSLVIATGGGFYKALQKDENFIIIYLKSSFDFIFQRLILKGLESRPLFQDPKQARLLYDSRLKDYENLANFTINVERKSARNIVNEALNLLEIGDQKGVEI